MRTPTLILVVGALLAGTASAGVGTASADNTADPSAPVLRLVRVNGRTPGNNEQRAVYEHAALPLVVQGKNTTVAVRTQTQGGDWGVVAEAALPQTNAPVYSVPLQDLTVRAPSYQGDKTWKIQVGWLTSAGTWSWGATTTFAVLKPDPTTPKSAARRWASLAGKKRARWNPCQQITYRVSVAGARGAHARALKQIRTSVTYIGHATGLNLKYLGKTAARAAGDGTSSADLTIVVGHFTDKQVAGNTKVWWAPLDGADFLVIHKAKIRLETRYDSPKFRSEFTRHELLHALGLGHSHDKADIMYPQATGRVHLGWGDKVGVRTIGLKAGCIAGEARVVKPATSSRASLTE